VGGAKISGSINAPNGQAVAIAAHDNGDGTYACSYPQITLPGNHSLQPQLNNEQIKDAPFTVAIEPGAADLSQFEWTIDGSDRVLIAGVEEKFLVKAKVRRARFTFRFSSFLFFFSYFVLQTMKTKTLYPEYSCW
jgi:hypothetical protein